MLCVWAAGAVLSPNGTIFEDNCKKTTTCEALKYNTCLGSPLPYTHTSLILAEDSGTQEEAFEKLTMWSGKFRQVPVKTKVLPISFMSLQSDHQSAVETSTWDQILTNPRCYCLDLDYDHVFLKN